VSSHAELRGIRFVIYISGFLYALVSIIDVPSRSVKLDDDNLFNSAAAASVVGTFQLILICLGLLADSLGERARPVVKPVFLLLTLTYLYTGVLLLVNVVEPFRWIPLFVYAAICAVIYLSER
jgi:hypothetical protein